MSLDRPNKEEESTRERMRTNQEDEDNKEQTTSYIITYLAWQLSRDATAFVEAGEIAAAGGPAFVSRPCSCRCCSVLLPFAFCEDTFTIPGVDAKRRKVGFCGWCCLKPGEEGDDT